MATRYLYQCKDCGLEGVVAGGASVIRAGETLTYYCDTCNELSDLLTEGLWLGEAKCPECEVCHTKALVEWVAGQPCPKCKGEMVKDEGYERLSD